MRGPAEVRILATENRNNPTKAEELLWAQLRGKRLGHRFRRQRVIGRFIVDFYCPSARLVIEVDGGIHEMKEQIELGTAREAFLTAQGFHILRFRNDDLIDHMGKCLDRIDEYLKSLTARR